MLCNFYGYTASVCGAVLCWAKDARFFLVSCLSSLIHFDSLPHTTMLALLSSGLISRSVAFQMQTTSSRALFSLSCCSSSLSTFPFCLISRLFTFPLTTASPPTPHTLTLSFTCYKESAKTTDGLLLLLLVALCTGQPTSHAS